MNVMNNCVFRFEFIFAYDDAHCTHSYNMYFCNVLDVFEVIKYFSCIHQNHQLHGIIVCLYYKFNRSNMLKGIVKISLLEEFFLLFVDSWTN